MPNKLKDNFRNHNFSKIGNLDGLRAATCSPPDADVFKLYVLQSFVYFLFEKNHIKSKKVDGPNF